MLEKRTWRTRRAEVGWLLRMCCQSCCLHDSLSPFPSISVHGTSYHFIVSPLFSWLPLPPPPPSAPLDLQLPYHILSVDIPGPSWWTSPMFAGRRHERQWREVGPTLLNGTEVRKVSWLLQSEIPHLTTLSLLLSVLHHPVHHRMMVRVCAPM